ncbi:MAG: hypothetical protein PHX62_00685, partial [Bacilli bacterium]|nr:hypothetical protein [Bacilli bacterium]
MTLLKNNVKKIFVLVLALLASFSLVACKEDTEDIDPETKISEALGSIALGDTNSITQSFDLIKTTGKHQLTITWSVTNTVGETVALDLTGATPRLVVTQAPYTEDENGKPTNDWGEATLKATVSVGDKSSSREWPLWVKPAEKVLDMTVAEVLASADYTVVGFKGTVSYVHGSGFYVADDTASIYVYGKASNPKVLAGAEVTVEGTKKVAYGQPEIDKGYKVTVTKDAPATGYDYASAVVDAYVPEIAWQPASNFDMYGKVVKISGKVTEGTYGSNTNLEITDEITETKVMLYYDADPAFMEEIDAKKGKYVSVTVLLYNFHSSDKVWRAFGYAGTITELTAAPTYDNEDKLNLAAIKLTGLLAGIGVSKDLTLPDTSEFETTVTWVSKNTAIIGNDGKFTAPATTTEVELEATIKLGADEKKVTLKVNALAVDKITVAELLTAIDEEEAENVAVEGVIIGRDSDGYFYLADATGVVYVRQKLSDHELEVGDTVVVVGNGSIFDKTSRYNRQFADGTASVEKIDKEITPIAAVNAEISDFDNTITAGNLLTEVVKEELNGKVFKVEGYLVFSGAYNDLYFAESLEAGAAKIGLYYKGMEQDALKFLVGKKVKLTAVVYEYRVSTGWNLGFLGRDGDLEITLTNAEKEALAKAEIDAVMPKDNKLSGNIVFLTETAYSYAFGNVTYLFTSNNTEVLDNEGKFTLPDANTTVTVTVKATFGEAHTKDFVYNLEALADADVVYFTSGFEDVVKGSYASEDVTIDGVVWTLADVLVGNLEND